MSLIFRTIIGLAIAARIFPAVDEYNFKQFTDADGLSQSTIFSMTQDREGFLWLGTIDGLNRYDGYNFKIYVNVPDDTTSISDNFISALYEDKDGFIWVGTVNGYFNRFNKKTDSFKRFYSNDFFTIIKNPDVNFYEYPLAFSRNQINSITSITEDAEGFLWIGTWGNGIIKFDRKKETGTHIYHDKDNPQSLSSNRILEIIKDSDDDIWIATFGGGLNKLIKDGSTNNHQSKLKQIGFLHYTFSSNDSYSLRDNKLISLFEDRDGNLWIGTYHGGLNKLDSNDKNLLPENARFTNYNSQNPNLSDNAIMAIQQDLDGYLWIGTFGGGIDRLDTRNHKSINFSKMSIPQNAFPHAEILSLFIDRSGILWAGSHLGEGVTKIQKAEVKFDLLNSKSPGKFQLNDDVVWALFKDSRSNLWIGTYRGGVNVLNFKTGEHRIYKYSPDKNSGLSDNHIRAITEDKFGNIWIGTYSGGLNRIKPNTGEITIFKNEPGNSNSLSANQVLDIFVQSENRIWVATFGGGLNELIFNDNTSGIPEFKSFMHDSSDITSISDDRVYTILKSDKNFWVGTYGGGLNKFDQRTGKFKVVFPNSADLKADLSNKILSIHISPDSLIWIGTSGFGLNKFDLKNNSVKNYSLAQGLTSSVVYGIIEDKNSNLWLSTDDGIFLFNTSTESFTQFGIEDGVQSLEFSGGAYFEDSEGMIYFGGINGFNYFYPDQVTINQYVPPVVITNLSVVNVTAKGIPEELILSYDQNFISIEFSALDFSIPKENKYQYILQGFQDSWISAVSSNRIATYTNLPPGEYTFLVKGTNEDGIWNQTPASLKIIVNPPFWNTWWFVTLVILIVVYLIYYLGTIRVKSELEIEKLKLKIASDLHDNIGAGLTEISILSEVAERSDNNSGLKVKSDLQKISETARQLVDSMSDIVWVVNPQRDSLHDLIVKLKDSYNEFFNSIGISFQVNNIERSDDIKLPMEYKQNLLLMFKEAINNAIKHSSCKKIVLDASYKNDIIEINLKDDGTGFDLTKVKQGNGIRNMENRAMKINGKLSWQQVNGGGTIIKFSGKLGRMNKFKSIFN